MGLSQVICSFSFNHFLCTFDVVVVPLLPYCFQLQHFQGTQNAVSHRLPHVLRMSSAAVQHRFEWPSHSTSMLSTTWNYYGLHVKQTTFEFNKVIVQKLWIKRKEKYRQFVGQPHLHNADRSHFEQVKGHAHKLGKIGESKLWEVVTSRLTYSGSWPNVKADDLLFSHKDFILKPWNCPICSPWVLPLNKSLKISVNVLKTWDWKTTKPPRQICIQFPKALLIWEMPGEWSPSKSANVNGLTTLNEDCSGFFQFYFQWHAYLLCCQRSGYCYVEWRCSKPHARSVGVQPQLKLVLFSPLG